MKKILFALYFCLLLIGFTQAETEFFSQEVTSEVIKPRLGPGKSTSNLFQCPIKVKAPLLSRFILFNDPEETCFVSSFRTLWEVSVPSFPNHFLAPHLCLVSPRAPPKFV